MVAVAVHRLCKALVVLMSSDGKVVLVLGPWHLVRGLKVSVRMTCHENGHVGLIIQLAIMIMQLNLLVRAEVTGNNSDIIDRRSGVEIVTLVRISVLVNNLLWSL